jgi:hypothetical protein
VCAVAVALAIPLAGATPAAAKPGPTGPQRVDRLSNQVEVLAEQWSGLRIQLQTARRTAALARRMAAHDQGRLDGMRRQVARLAAASYMSGDSYSVMALATSGDPRGVLDRAATVHRLSTRDDTVLRRLASAITIAGRTRTVATRRLAAVRRLRGRLAGKRTHIEKLLSGWQNRLTADALRRARTGHKFPPSALRGSAPGVRAARAALRMQGRPYVWGAAGPASFDCSGLVQWAYRAAGIRLPKYTLDQFHAGTPVPRGQLRPGDLVFFYPPSMHHVGIYIGDGMMVHAPHTGDVVRVSPIAGRAYGGGVRIAR